MSVMVEDWMKGAMAILKDHGLAALFWLRTSRTFRASEVGVNGFCRKAVLGSRTP